MVKRKREVTCGICLEDKDCQELTSLGNCTHRFCEECIMPWAEKENTCPTCRAFFEELILPSGSIRRVSRHDPDSVLHSAVILYILSATYRGDVARGYVHGHRGSRVIFEHIRNIIPFVSTDDIDFQIKIMIAMDAIKRLQGIYSTSHWVRTNH